MQKIFQVVMGSNPGLGTLLSTFAVVTGSSPGRAKRWSFYRMFHECSTSVPRGTSSTSVGSTLVEHRGVSLSRGTPVEHPWNIVDPDLSSSTCARSHLATGAPVRTAALLLRQPAAVDPATRAIDHKEACEMLCPELVITGRGTQISVNGRRHAPKAIDCNGPMLSTAAKLGHGDGDCDSDDDCLPGLLRTQQPRRVPGQRRLARRGCERGWDTTDDCCYAVRDGGFGGGVFFGMFLGALLLWMSTVAYRRGYCAGCCGRSRRSSPPAHPPAGGSGGGDADLHWRLQRAGRPLRELHRRRPAVRRRRGPLVLEI